VSGNDRIGQYSREKDKDTQDCETPLSEKGCPGWQSGAEMQQVLTYSPSINMAAMNRDMKVTRRHLYTHKELHVQARADSEPATLMVGAL